MKATSKLNRRPTPARFMIFVIVVFLTFHFSGRMTGRHEVDQALATYDRTVASPNSNAFREADQKLQAALDGRSRRELVVGLCSAAFLCLVWLAVFLTPRDAVGRAMSTLRRNLSRVNPRQS